MSVNSLAECEKLLSYVRLFVAIASLMARTCVCL